MPRSIKYNDFLDSMLKDEEFAAEYLSAALEEEFPIFISCLKSVIRVHGNLSLIAHKSKLSRSTIYRLFEEKSNPEIKTILALLHAIGYELKITKKQESFQKAI